MHPYRILMDPYRIVIGSLSDPYRSLMILIGPYRSLWILIDPYRILIDPYGSFLIPATKVKTRCGHQSHEQCLKELFDREWGPGPGS